MGRKESNQTNKSHLLSFLTEIGEIFRTTTLGGGNVIFTADWTELVIKL